MLILRICTKLPKKVIMIIIIIIIIKIKNCDGMFFNEVGLQHPNLRKWNPTMTVFLGITEIIF